MTAVARGGRPDGGGCLPTAYTNQALGAVAHAVVRSPGASTVVERLQRNDGPSDDRPTPRELEVLRLVARGLRNQEIARQLGISERTVTFHLSNLFAKLQASSRTELVHHARNQGWLA